MLFPSTNFLPDRAILMRTCSGADVSQSLRSLARHRGDIFGATEDEKRKMAEEEAQQKLREREKVAWDGHASSRDVTADRFQSGVRLDEQIAALHKAKGLTGCVFFLSIYFFEDRADKGVFFRDESSVGPRIGPAIPGQAAAPSLPRNLPPSLPQPPGPEVLAAQHTQFAGATISAAPQPQGLPPVMNPYGYGAGAAAAPQAAPPVPPPANYGMRQTAPLPPQGEALRVGMRPAEENPDEEPSAKRQRIPRMHNGQLYSEQEWLDSHPVSLFFFPFLPFLSLSFLVADSYLFCV
jgi:splicing factor 3A subunit 1